MDASRARGDRAEAVGAAYLEAQGYRILERNYSCSGGEIDIIAYDADVLCFVEVRSHTHEDQGDPLETIDAGKIRRVIHAARQYIEDLEQPWPTMRFDAVGIIMAEPPIIDLVREAFETDG